MGHQHRPTTKDPDSRLLDREMAEKRSQRWREKKVTSHPNAGRMITTKGIALTVALGATLCSRVVVGGVAEAQVSNTGEADTSEQGKQLGEDVDPTSIDPRQWSIVSQLFTNTLESLSRSWEVKPTFLPGTYESVIQTTFLFTLPPLQSSPDRFSHLFDIPDFATVLSDPTLVHGSDYAVLKYIERDGEEWSGQFPYDSIPLDHMAHLITEKAFSVVINRLHERWLPVAKFAKALELETMSHSVSCNLYLTPAGGARGFESHLDWMDVIVVQVIGEKDWSVWTEPLLDTVLPDEKRKPTRQELQAKSPASVRLEAGDALYIPRGFLHNATTPTESDAISLHLTFGIEHLCETTMEALLHHALHLFVQSGDAKANLAKSIAVPAGSVCSLIEGFSAGNGISFETLLHLAMSEVVRRTDCGGFGEQVEKMRGSRNAAICRLRRSVALHPQFEQTTGRSFDEVQRQYLVGLEAVASELSATSAIHFLNKVTAKPDPTANAGIYCFPEALPQDYSYQCNPAAISVSTQKKLEDFASAFLDFAKQNFAEARKRMIESNALHHRNKWRGVDWVQQGSPK